ncbi:type II secretion system protein [Nocardioides zhouii]|uniref:Type II secretion system protein n=1 Tax=Nocardioides zhouii TaxID=1168729 RepID=A0A4Q2SXK5_9ACTN|nr:type II secretion system protein [Nocardioides zhouii]
MAVFVWLPADVRAAVPRPRRRSGPGLRPVAAVGVGAAAWLFVGGPTGPVAGAAAAAAAWWVLARAESPSRRREREEVLRTLPHLIDLFASTLRSGAEPVAGLAQVCAALPGPAADRLAPVVERARWGAGGLEAWQVLSGDDELAPLARAMVRSLTSGASVVQTVERLADELARESAARAEDAARRVGVAAAVPLGLCLLPAFLLLGVVPTVASLFGSVVP